MSGSKWSEEQWTLALAETAQMLSQEWLVYNLICTFTHIHTHTYTHTHTGLCALCMVDAEFSYTYEYQGNAPKLVHTPLTDKCYLTLTQGMHMGLGGNPYGPAGTGKTESVKALGGLCGRQVLVFNCDEVSVCVCETCTLGVIIDVLACIIC